MTQPNRPPTNPARFRLTIRELLGSGRVPEGGAIAGLDEGPPNELVCWLSRKTGHAPCRIRAMTLSGYVPSLLDGIAPPTATLGAYVARIRLISRLDEPIVDLETAPWMDAKWGAVWGCTACLSSGAFPYRRRHWLLPWMLTCPKHECFLENVVVLQGGSWSVFASPFGHAPLERDLLRLDEVTHQAVTQGHVDTPGDRIDGGTWVRLLRAVLEELARFAPNSSSRGVGIAEIWDDLGIVPPMAEVRSCPYEALLPAQKLRRMRAAALAVERARSLLTDWMDGNGLTVVDPEADALRRQWIWR